MSLGDRKNSAILSTGKLGLLRNKDFCYFLEAQLIRDVQKFAEKVQSGQFRGHLGGPGPHFPADSRKRLSSFMQIKKETLRYTEVVLLAILLAGVVGCGLTGSANSKTSAIQPPPPSSSILTPSATSLNFGADPVGTTSSPQSLTLQNSGTTAITVNTVQAAAPFAVSGFSGATSLNAGQTLPLSVTFTPTAPGSASGTLSATSSATNSPLAVALSGTGQAPIISVNPTSLGFGNQTVGTTSSSQTITVTNQGQLNLSLNQVSISPSVFLLTGPTAPVSISPSSSVTYNVSFNPSAVLSYTGSVTFTSNAFNGVASTSLSGTGVTATTVLNVSPSTLSFGNQIVNTPSSPQTVTLTNAGGTSITISTVLASAPFAVSGFSSSTTLNPGQSLALAVTFTPTAQTSYTGTLTITSTAPSSPNTVSLSGTGISQPSIDLTPPICGLTNDTTNHVPDPTAWTNFVPPPKGGTYVDALYGCPVKRLTDANAYGEAIHHIYSTVEPMSAGDTKIIVTGENTGQFIIDLNGNTVVSRSNMPPVHGQLQWDRKDDNVFYGNSGNTVQKCTVNSGAGTASCTSVHTFPEYAGYRIQDGDESSMTPNGWLYFVGQNVQGGHIDVFMYNPWTDTKSPAYTTLCTGDVASGQPGCIHKLITTADGGVIVQFSGGTAPEVGDKLWGPESSPPWTLTTAVNNDSHFDSGKDLAGNPVMVEERDADNLPASCPSQYGPAVRQFLNGTVGCMYDEVPANSGGLHISYRDYPTSAWAVYSPQADSSAEHFNNDSTYVAPSSSNWHQYDNEIIAVRIDNNNSSAHLYRLTLAHSRIQQGFWAEPHGAVSFDGKYVVFDSNAAWGQTGCGSLSNCSDLYLIKVH